MCRKIISCFWLLCILCAVSGYAQAETVYTCNAMADTTLRSADNETNFGTDVDVLVAGDDSGADISRGVFRFNIPSFVTAGQVQEAVLHLKGQSGDDVAVNIHPVTGYWYEKDLFEPDMTQLIWGATWSSPGGDFDATESQAVIIADGWNAIDITTLFADNLDTIQKYGILMKLQDEAVDQSSSIYSRDNSDFNPYIELTVDLGLKEGEHLCPVIHDVYIDSGREYNLNFKTRILVSWHPSYGTSRGLWRFDIPSGISASAIDNATMYISGSEHVSGGETLNVELFALNEPFAEEKDTWTSLNGGDYDTEDNASDTLPNTGGMNWYKEIDVTGLLSSKLDKVRDYGLLMKSSAEEVSKLHQNIASRESADATDRAAYLLIQCDTSTSSSSTTTTSVVPTTTSSTSGGNNGGGPDPTTTTAPATTTTTLPASTSTTTTIPPTTTTSSIAPPPEEPTTTTTVHQGPCPVELLVKQADAGTAGLFRRFRDQRLNTTGLGLSLCYVYYAHAGEMVRILTGKPDLGARVGELLQEVIPAFRRGLEQGAPIIVTKKQVRAGAGIMEEMQRSASPELYRGIETLIRLLVERDALKQFGVEIAAPKQRNNARLIQ